MPPDEEVESSLLKYLGAPGTDGISYTVAVARFNSNIDYAGLVHAVSEDGWFKENKEKLIHAALTALLTNGEKTDTAEHLAGEFLAIRRLVASKAGFQVPPAPGPRFPLGARADVALTVPFTPW